MYGIRLLAIIFWLGLANPKKVLIKSHVLRLKLFYILVIHFKKYLNIFNGFFFYYYYNHYTFTVTQKML